MTELEALQKSEIMNTFRWRDRMGAMWHPKEMKTSHLYHVVSMIWNHAVPEEYQTHNFRRYSFSYFYTADYMKQAIRVLLPELLRRDDVLPEWEVRLEFMRSCASAVSDFEEVKHLGVPS